MTAKLDKSKTDQVASAIISGEGKESRGRKAGAILFPRTSLIEALKVAQAIWDYNAGNPYPIMDIAKKLNYSPTTGNFRELLRAAERYGLTIGTYSNDLTKTIALSEVGKSLVAPQPDEDVNALKRRALETPDLFRNVFGSIQGKVIPPADSMKNLLVRTYGLSKEDAARFCEVFDQNVKELGIAEDIAGKLYLRLDKLGTGQIVQIAQKGGEGASTGPEPVPPTTISQTTPPAPATIEVKVPKVFISHSKSKKILDQIKQSLDFGKFEYVIAEEKETTAIPLSDKVFNLMWDCNCAIINISADAEKKQGEVFGINENVIAELWGAYLHYRKRVIIVIDKRLKDKLPSILQGLTAIFYEGDQLTWDDGMRLQKSLGEFRNQL
jgi:hypothetical protein